MKHSDHDVERTLTNSRSLHRAACDLFPGGVSHNVRFEPPLPVYIDRTSGAQIWDVDGYEYVDFWNNHHTSILGHAHPDVVAAVTRQAGDGLHYGMPNELAIEVGRRIPDFVPSAERIRFCASGTEATMYAVRLARAFTGRDMILKVEGGWHGGNTDLSIAVHAPFDAPTTAGLPPGATDYVRAFPLNDQNAVEELLSEHRGEVAAIIIDPRKSGVEPDREFLRFLEEVREDHGCLLIFDEVVTGFRVSPGSYQARVGITPDLTTLGKVLGGGLPVGALVGRAELFEPARPDIDVSPDERVIAGGGTFTVNPMTLSAGLATLRVLDEEPVYDHTETLAERLRDGVETVFEEHDVDGKMLGVSSLLVPVLNVDGPIESPSDVLRESDGEAVRRYHQGLCDAGYFFLPGHMGNISYKHTAAHVEGVIDASERILSTLSEQDVV